jgi:biopolymer transport protein ExbB/TolQ
MLDTLLNYLSNSTAITIGVLVLLSLYLVLSIWIYVYKYLSLKNLTEREKNNLKHFLSGDVKINPLSSIGHYVSETHINKELLEVSHIVIMKEASRGIHWESIFASTAPFIGLFGTVVGILESFAKFAGVNKVSFATIAPVISEALIATAAGILVAIFAYTFHQILTQKLYILDTHIRSQMKIILSRI